MRRSVWQWVRVIALLLSLLATTACRRSQPTPPPQSSPAPTHTASTETATPVTDVQSAARPAEPTPPRYRILGSDTAPTTLVNARGGYTLTLPAGWYVLDLPLNGVDNAVQPIAESSDASALADVAATFVHNDGSNHIEVVAKRIAADHSETVLTLMVIPRHGLSLESYLSAFVEQLAKAGEMYNLGEETVDHELREDHMPVGLLRYAPTSPNAEWQYAHVVLMAPTGEHLIALTIATTGVSDDSVTDVVQEIVAAALQLQLD